MTIVGTTVTTDGGICLMDQSAFLSDIVEHPDDDTPRLVFADWLDDHGNDAQRAWADFIRVQIERARLPADDDRQAELEARERRLAVAHALDWVAPPWDLRNLRFRRGLPETLLTTAVYVSERQYPLRDFPIRELSLSFAPGADHKRLRHCVGMARIESLKLRGSRRRTFPEEEIRAILEGRHLSRLRALEISGNMLEDHALARLLALPVLQQLESLHISDNILHVSALIQLATMLPWPRLRWLSLHSNGIGVYGAEALFNSDFWPRLEEIDLMGLPFDGEQGLVEALEACSATRLKLTCTPADGPTVTQALGEARFWGQLRSLELVNAPFGLGHLDQFLAHPGLAKLEHLALRNCQLSPWDMKRIAACPSLGNLRRLEVQGNRGAFAALASSKYVRQLRSLTGTDEDAGVIAFLRSPNSAHLRQQHLESDDAAANRLSNLIAEALADSPHLAHLTTLIAPFGTVSDKGARAVACSPHLANLTFLSVEGCPIRASGQRALMEAEHIAWVGINEHDIRQADVKEMRQRRYRGMRWDYWLATDDDPTFPGS
jgi:uncharacterized protein (TIGR02996 family)